MILRKKSLARKFVFLSVLTMLWSYKAFNPVWVTSYPQMYKVFHPWFPLHIFVNYMETEPLHSFRVVLTISHELRFEWLNCVST